MTDSSQQQFNRRQFLLRAMTTCSASALMLSVCGCQIFDKGVSNIIQQTSLLPQMGPTRNAVQLEIVFIERPLNDPLLGKALWKEVDQIGALDPAVRDILKKNGFKVGVAASEPPEALQAMLQKAINKRNSQNQTESSFIISRIVTLLEGTTSDLQTSDNLQTCTVDIQKKRGTAKQKEFSQARCLFRVEARRLQEGWVTLQFIPEIQHGDKKLRHTAGDRSWNFTTSQAKYPLYEQQFEITLNVGEMAMITSQGEKTNSLGTRLFTQAIDNDNDSEEAMQRLLVVRLKDVSTSQGIKTE